MLGKEEAVAGQCPHQGLLLAYGSTCLIPSGLQPVWSLYGSRTQQPPRLALTAEVA